MDILNPRSLREDAARALNRGRDPKKLVFSYAGIVLALSLVVTLGNLILDDRISGTGGLSNMGTRAIFSTIQQLLPAICSLVAMCLEFGYLSGMLRIARGQYADHTDLKVGLQKFWPLVRLMILQGLVILLVAIVSFQAGSMMFAMTPWAEPVLEMSMELYNQDLTAIDEQTLLNFMKAATPMYVIGGILFFAALIPVLFRLRMSLYCLLDDPNGRAIAAMRSSNQMMRRRFLSMLKVDLSLWVYHLANVLIYVMMYIDLILVLLGISVPMDPLVFSLLVYAAALVVQFGVQVTLRNKVEAVYITAYDRLREKPKEGGPVVLGNIFDM